MRWSPFWSHFWLGKLTALGRQGVHVTSRTLRDRQHSIVLPDGSHHRWLAPEEKGIDVRIAVDLVGMAYRRLFDVAIVFSQDQDLAEVVDEVRHVARFQHRWIKVASAFPAGPSARIQYGVAETDWIPIDAATYERCIDPRDYRPKRNPS